ncbi:MAG: ABC transporter ATP-binding protein [Chloroflexota bacterium]
MPALQTQNLTTGYTRRRQQVVVSSDLELELNSGELTCLLGPNGAGKSTLMRTLAGMQQSLSGQIDLMSQDLQSMSASERAKYLSVVLTERPDGGLLNGYALVALGRQPYTGWSGRLTQHDRDKVQWAVDAVNAADIAHLPLTEMSDGQRQKIMIARALAQEPTVMFLDEPTAFLDLPRRVEILRLLRTLAHDTDMAILLSTHDLDLALRTADRLWLMDDNGGVHTGMPEALIINGTFARVFHSSGVPFDANSGGFNIYESGRAVISVTGDTVYATWTRRALQRIGFTVVDDDRQTDRRVTINDQSGRVIWIVQTARGHTQLHTLEDTISYITMDPESTA